MYTALIQGILVGGLYACAGLALALIFGVLKIVNLAHGELLLSGAYLSLALGQVLGWHPLATLPLVVAAMAALGYALHRGVLGPIANRGGTSVMITTFGIALVLQALFTGLFSANPKSLPGGLSTVGVDILGVSVQLSYVVAFSLSVVLVLVTHLALNHTRWGVRVRATAADSEVSALMGINVPRLQASVFALAAALAAVGGVTVGLSTSFTPTSGAPYLVIGFAIVVLGGIGNILGTLVGAIILGVVQSMGAFAFGGGYRDLALYVVFLLVLTLRPQGLFTRVGRTA